MKVLLLAGLGPYFKQGSDLLGSLFDPRVAADVSDGSHGGYAAGFRLEDLAFTGPDNSRHRLLRRERSGSLSLTVDRQPAVDRTPIPSLAASTLLSILSNAGVDHEYLPLDNVWEEDREPSGGAFDCVLLSTTFICDRVSLARAITWINTRLPGVPIVVGGQFTNLKYELVLRDHPEVLAVVRGDGEAALPLLLRALERGESYSSIPNLVLHGPAGRGSVSTELQYVDIESHPAPTFRGTTPIVPYESMRGCPYSCKFCSFPAASPTWRYKSARKIASDWKRYRDLNDTIHIRALDSTFTVPPRRLKELLGLLPELGIGWEAFSRANSISSPAMIDDLARANCRTLSIGFESMSDNSLEFMNKKVSAKQNRIAFDLLRGGPVGYRMSFMVGYPGETPDDYLETHDFLVNEYEGHFQLSVFSLQDETMPVWEDAERFALRVTDSEDPDYSWTHIGMDVKTARILRQQTLTDVRWKNDGAVPFLWQTDYQTPLLPHRPAKDNYRAEKLVERIAFLPIDHPDPARTGSLMRMLLAELASMGIFLEVSSATRG